MGGAFRSALLFLLLPILLLILLRTTAYHHPYHHQTVSLSLSTNSRWIIDDRNGGERVKLSCVNWVSHLDTAVAEGLSKQPVDVISKKILEMGFNCVRLTYPLFLFTDDNLGSTTVRQSLQSLGLWGSVAGVQANNPAIVDLSLINAFQEVVSNLDENNIMIILDNHVSKPGWCCNDNDGNGFFGDLYFDPEVWIKGVTRVAIMFQGYTNVVGMSLRNELRGPRQNVKTWYKYMQNCAERVHAANPNVLVILSGLNYDLDLSFLRNNPVSLSFNNKLVYEVHWYGFSNGDDWIMGNSNDVCGRITDTMAKNAMFLLDQGYPLFMSEWGVDQRGTNENDNRFLNCLLGLAAEHDLDWALWTLVGSYYLREGVAGMEEFYGVLNWNWREPRNSSFLKKISSLQSPFQAPGLSNMAQHKIIFHPLTGLCVQSRSSTLGPCSNAEAWDYTIESVLMIKGTNSCLKADDVNTPVKVGVMCRDASSRWDAISASKMHLSSSTNNGTIVCLDIDSQNTLITNTSPGLSNMAQHKIIFHPLTGLCVQSRSSTLGPCSNAEAWDYTIESVLMIKGTHSCLKADDVNTPVKVGVMCRDASSRWDAISASKMHLSSSTNNGTIVCLDIDSQNTLITNTCKCLTKELCDPASQWFKVINSTSFNFLQPTITSDSILKSPG